MQYVLATLLVDLLAL